MPTATATSCGNSQIRRSPGTTWPSCASTPRFRSCSRGSCTPDDARLAVEHGVDGIIVSNHGGRRSTARSPPSTRCPRWCEAVGGALRGPVRQRHPQRRRRLQGARAGCASGAARSPLPVGSDPRRPAGRGGRPARLSGRADLTMALSGCATIDEVGPEALVATGAAGRGGGRWGRRGRRAARARRSGGAAVGRGAWGARGGWGARLGRGARWRASAAPSPHAETLGGVPPVLFGLSVNNSRKPRTTWTRGSPGWPGEWGAPASRRRTLRPWGGVPPVLFALTVNNSRKPRTSLDARLARVAGRQHGVVTIAQMVTLGFDRQRHPVPLASGQAAPGAPGRICGGHSGVSWEGRRLAEVLSIGHGAVLSHLSAAALWGLLADRGPPVDVTVDRRVRRPGTSRSRGGASRRRRADARGGHSGDHRGPHNRRPRRRGQRAGAQARPARGARAAQAGRARSSCPDRPGATTPRYLPARGSDRPRARADSQRARGSDAGVVVEHGFPRPAVNVAIDGLPRPVEVDFLFADRRLILEADGARFHDHRLAREEDAAKQAMLEAAGYRVVRLSWWQVTREVEQTVRRLRHVLAAQASPEPRGGAPAAQ